MPARHNRFPDPEDERKLQKSLALLDEMNDFLEEYPTAESCEAIGISADRRAQIEASRDALRRAIDDMIEKGRALIEANDEVERAQSALDAWFVSVGMLPN